MNYQYEKINDKQYRVYGRDYDTIHTATKKEAQQIVEKLEAEWLEELKKLKIGDLNENINRAYKEYLSRYPEVEIRSFEQKAKEAFLAMADNETPLEKTPLLVALVGQDKTKRNLLASQVFEKVKENATLEAWGVITRDAIKAAESEQALNAISITIPTAYDEAMVSAQGGESV